MTDKEKKKCGSPFRQVLPQYHFYEERRELSDPIPDPASYPEKATELRFSQREIF